jgi:hypothetical protein
MADDDLDRDVARAFAALDDIEPPDLADRIFGTAAGSVPRVTLPLTATPRLRQRRRWIAGVAAALLLLGGGVAIGVLLARDSAPDGPTMLPASLPPGVDLPGSSDPLRSALEELGADVAGAPAGAATLDGGTWCGAELPPGPDVGGDGEGRRRCLLDAHLAASPAVFVQAATTIEGDPVVTVWRTLGDGTVHVFTDATRDRFGSGTWETQSCARLATRYPGGADGNPPTMFGCADDSAAPVVPTAEPVPDWFTAREVLPLCGYAVRLVDVDTVQRDCFERAFVEGQPGEFAYVDLSGGVRTARWFRVTATGAFEVIEQTITDGSAVWQRYACAEVGTVDGADPGWDDVPFFDPAQCTVGVDADAPPSTSTPPTPPPPTAPPGTIMATDQTPPTS